ncbi:MAG: ribbon-helix-helix protein, CopG family [Acidiferrobacterales bacterium]
MPTSVRLDPETEALLRRLARRSGRTKSDMLREALLRLAEEEDTAARAGHPYAMMSDLVGIATGGPPELARAHKRAFREALSKRNRQ